MGPGLYVAIFLIGILVGFYVRRKREYSGTINVIYDEKQNKTIYSLELEDDPEMLMFKNEVVFKIIHPEQSSDRT